ncbi:double-strand-break repair protein rad21-like protein 1 [Genypterus blacodes]|uniref:double-strand-break repair protein rad21-like protein 1 n=1 Tax=Genypterus blacodes TaxID=154954 RepID=UPI003F770D85
MMFYTQLFTSKRGPLAKVWLAAHWDRKLTKAHVFECNLETTVEDIISPKMKIGLRTSGHLLLGVVRIYFRKAKYLLVDCSDALVKIKREFRPDQTDMPTKGLEAKFTAITLIENFTDFDIQPLQPRNIDDHLTLNQSRIEEITMKEDFGNNFLTLADLGGEPLCLENTFDLSFQTLALNKDAFGDENNMFSTLEADRAALVEAEPPILNECTSMFNAEETFALEPVAATSSLKRKKEKRKRKLVVDQTKQLSNEAISNQLADISELVGPMDMAPPTCQLMRWKEEGSAAKLLGQTCSPIIAPQIKELFTKSVFLGKNDEVGKETEEFRQDGPEVQGDTSGLTIQDLSVVGSSMNSEQMQSADEAVLDHMTHSQIEDLPEPPRDESRLEFTQLELPSEDSMVAQPDTQSTSMHTQSLLSSQDLEERKIMKQTQKLLNTLKSQSSSDSTFSLQALCERKTRSQAAVTFICLLLLKKRQALHLHQEAPYEDVLVTPGPKFYDL